MFMAKLTFNNALCKGCALCVDACPKKLLKMSKTNINSLGYFTVEADDLSACTGCAACAIMCPDIVIEIER